MTKAEFIALEDKERKQNKGKWVALIEIVDERRVGYKAFNTWVQVLLNGNGVRYSGPMDCKVSEFKKFLEDSL